MLAKQTRAQLTKPSALLRAQPHQQLVHRLASSAVRVEEIMKRAHACVAHLAERDRRAFVDDAVKHGLFACRSDKAVPRRMGTLVTRIVIVDGHRDVDERRRERTRADRWLERPLKEGFWSSREGPFAGRS